MVYLTRVEHFNAAHKLCNEHWTDEKNRQMFGKCANHYFHGHNFDVYVTVKGKPNPDTGFVINAHDLSAIMKREIVERFDHKNLNLDIPYFQNILPSSENLVIYMWNILKPLIKEGELHSIKLQETPRIYVEYFGE